MNNNRIGWKFWNWDSRVNFEIESARVYHHHLKRMGNCLTGDVAGGKQAIGGVQQRPTSTNNAGQNDAVDFFFRSRGQYPLFSQIEVSSLSTILGFFFLSCRLLLSLVWFINCSQLFKVKPSSQIVIRILLNWIKNNPRFMVEIILRHIQF